MPERVLIVDDDPDTRASMGAIARREGWEVHNAANAEEAASILQRQDVELILCDLVMPGIDGLEFLRRIKASGGRTPFVMVTGHASVESAVEALRIGAFDYLSKPVRLSVLRATLAKVKRLEAPRDATPEDGPRLEGASEAIRRVQELAELAAPSRSTILITGETGTGKEILAETIHRMSPRASNRIVKVNCAALPDNLIESELFGHEKGAFTGADRVREGRFEAAHGGTIFLDEVSEMSWAAQARLLRVLQVGEFERVGSSQTRKTDVRVIAATNQDLRALVQEKKFREDLYYRLHVVELKIPPLRERREDIPILATALLSRIARDVGRPAPVLTERAARMFDAYSWPGNVRELEHVLEHAFILSRGGPIEPEHLPAEIRPERPRSIRIHVGTSLASAEKEIIRATLEAVGDDKREAARLLGLSRSALYRRLEDLGDTEADGAPPGAPDDDAGRARGSAQNSAPSREATEQDP